MPPAITELPAGRRILAITALDPGGDVAVTTAAALARGEGGVLAVALAIPRHQTVRPLFPQHLVEDALATARAPLTARQQLRRRST